MRIRRISMETLAAYVTIIFFVVFAVFPVFWFFMSAFRPQGKLYVYPPEIIPSSITFENFVSLFALTNEARYIANSFLLAGVSTVLSVGLATLTGYSIARFTFRGRGTLKTMSLFVYMISPVSLVLPFFMLLSNLGLIDSHVGLILLYTAFGLPLSIWLLTLFFAALPRVFEEAAMVDGCTRFQAFIRITIPQSIPGIVAAAMFTLLYVFNEFLYALIFLFDDTLRTIPSGLYFLAKVEMWALWELLMPAGVIATIIPIVFFAMIQGYLIKGWAVGTVKA